MLVGEDSPSTTNSAFKLGSLKVGSAYADSKYPIGYKNINIKAKRKCIFDNITESVYI